MSRTSLHARSPERSFLSLLILVAIGTLILPRSPTAAPPDAEEALQAAITSSNVVWSALSPSGPLPSSRQQHAAIYDPVRKRLVVFGGKANTVLVNDTWALTLGPNPTWQMLATAGTPPSPRRGHSAVYDANRDRMIVFGGNDGAYRNDTWELSFASNPPTWNRLSTAGSPPPYGLYGHVAVYDRERLRMIVYGG